MKGGGGEEEEGEKCGSNFLTCAHACMCEELNFGVFLIIILD